MTAQPPPPSRQPGADSYERNLQRIRLRQDTTANWEKNDPIPASGELCYTIDGGNVGQKLKVGDGFTSWTQIPYLAGRGQSGPPGPPGADGGGTTIVGTIDHCGPPTAEDWPNPEVGDLIIVDCGSPSNIPVPDGDGAVDACGDCDGDAYSYGKTGVWLSIGKIKGKQGDKGDKGDSATVSVKSTKTGDPGTDALVSNSGSTQNAELDFTIPRGDQGIQGIQGPQGPGGGIGLQGPKGDKGDTGDAFEYEDFTPQQLEDLTGPQGPKGDQGDKGDKGDDGDAATVTLTPAVAVQKDETIVQNRGEFTLTNSDPLAPNYTLSLELIPDSGDYPSMCQIEDVDCGEGPLTPQNILVWDASFNNWVPSGAGNANLGNMPIGGWFEGSVGEAIQQAGESGGGGGDLPISSTDGTVKLDSPSANTFTVSTGGAERVTFTDAAAAFSGQVQTDKITSKAGASNDAQMLFRTSATLYANYSTPLTIESGKDSSFVNYKNGSSDSYFTGIGTTKEFEISTGASTADDARIRLSTDCTLTKGDGTAWEPKSDNSLVTKGWVTNTGGGIGTLPISSTDGTVTLESPSANTFTVSTGGQERLTLSDAVVKSVAIKTPSVSGLAANDASIELGDELLTTNHTPNQPNSIATKAYVDANAGGGGASIEAGTPSSAGAAGSPGDMKFDDNYLWLRTSTEWKKIPLTAYAGTAATATVQLTQAQYDALATKDPNTLYVIVG